ncbi:MAG: hypothetical protein ABJM82_20995 [Shimia thalassica]|uniref:hypothetical protein n=1 Tax=Shimia thalassica TaxID=1715693 RepID=UPI003298516F
MTVFRELFLHVGHNFTASPLLQSSLEQSRSILAEQGVHYQVGNVMIPIAFEGKKTNGISQDNQHKKTLALDLPSNGSCDRLLLSDDALFNMLATDPRQLYLNLLREKFEDGNIQVFLCIRDPLDHAIAVYDHLVKRGGYYGAFSSFLERYNTPALVHKVLDQLLNFGANVSVVNQSRHNNGVLSQLNSWLGLAPGELTNSAPDLEDRRLTPAELEIQKLFNRRFGRAAARFVSVPLCKELPMLQPSVPHLSSEKLVAFLDRSREMCNNAMSLGVIPESEAWYVPSDLDAARFFSLSSEEGEFELSQEQINVLARTVSSRIRRGML